MHVVMMVSVLRTRQLALADRAVAIGIELGEQRVGSRGTDARVAERALEFRLADLAVTVGVELGEQLRWRLGRHAGCRLALQRKQRGHGAGAERRKSRTAGA